LIKYNQELDLSEQQVVDCDKKNSGCKGGWANYAFDGLIKEQGITTESNYPYLAENGTCRSDQSWIKYKNLGNGPYLDPQGDENALMDYLKTKGPPVAYLHATIYFEFYDEGILTDDDCTNKDGHLNHAVHLVGYGTDEVTGLDYWLVKNSWGKFLIFESSLIDC
jgi:KDEL-tailed cysteine endopeptidase